MTSILITILRFPPVLHVVRIGLASVAEWLLYKLLEVLPWRNEHRLIVNLVIMAAGILFVLYLFRLILREVKEIFSWLYDWWKGGGSGDSNDILV